MINDAKYISENGVSPKEAGVVFLFIFAITLAVYWNALSFDFLSTWDDPVYIVNNASAHGFSADNLKTAFSRFYVGNYAPLQIVSYMLDYTFWGLKATGYTLHNILLHTLNGLLIFLLLRRFSLPQGASLLGVLLFILHPVQVESVVWLSQRKNVLAMFFLLLALHAFIRFREREHGSLALYLLALIFFAASLLTKSVTVVFPLLIFLYDIIVVRRKIASALVAALPFAILAFAIAYLTMISQSEAYAGGGRADFHGGGRLATLFTMLPVFATYVRMLFAPYGLSLVYAPQIRQTPDLVVLISAVLLLFLVWVGYVLLKKDRLCFFWYLAIPVFLLPVSQIVPLVTLMNDRYLYFPMVGVAAVTGIGLASLQGRAVKWQLTLATAVVIVVLLGGLSLQRSLVWKTPFSLWQDAALKQPSSAVALMMLASLQTESEPNRALVNANRARELCKGAECYHAIEVLYDIYLKGNRIEYAEKCADELIMLYPNYANGYLMKGYLKYRNNELELAEKLFSKGTGIDPNQPSALHALGNIYMSQGNLPLAREKLLAAYNLGSQTPELAYSLARLEVVLGNKAAALKYLESAFRLGFKRSEMVMASLEFKTLQEMPEFKRLMSQYFTNR